MQLKRSKNHLLEELQKLEEYYSKQGSKKKIKSNDEDNKKNLKQVKYVYSLTQRKLQSLGYLMKSDKGIYYYSPSNADNKQILGELDVLPQTYNQKILYAKYNFTNKYAEIFLNEAIDQVYPFEYIKSMYLNYGCKDAFDIIQLSEEVQKHLINSQGESDDYRKFTKTDSQRKEIEQIIQRNQNKISQITIFSSKDNDNTQKYILNEKLIQLMGVLPNIFIESVLTQQGVPNLCKNNRNFIKYWMTFMKGFLFKDSDSEEEIFINLFEGISIPVVKKTNYFNFIDEESKEKIFVEEVTFQILQKEQYDMIFNSQRICNNSAQYLNEENIIEKNKLQNYHFQTYLKSKQLANLRTDKCCGIKELIKN